MSDNQEATVVKPGAQFAGGAARSANVARPSPMEAITQLKSLLTNTVVTDALKPLRDRVEQLNQELNRTHALVQTMFSNRVESRHIDTHLEILGELRNDYLDAVQDLKHASEKMKQVGP